ncbi:hypothetical protein A500_04586 [Clostridium sartagoforme AAU1]|uniref:Uncharacterized protein n=1 Tax=Clostridium sartagoforme AAU1 TaxID=1202534 RepID=R9CEG8_9CLOT|nr:hypothetical protein [Clostridium sartagoforme]EOR27390.1 hypothetical protein A500_04586 [Clostridium sartagoforme AAU1]
MILAVETARLEYKIKQYNSNYIDNFELPNINKIHLLEDNRELFENLEAGIACLAEDLNESTFNEIGSLIEQLLMFILSDKKTLMNSDYGTVLLHLNQVKNMEIGIVYISFLLKII